MKKKPTSNKADKFDEEMYFKRQMPKDKEERELASSLYEKRKIPKRKFPRGGK